MDKTDKKILWTKAKMDKELTWDKDADTVVTTPQSQWTPFQIAVANLNPELKQRNKRYHSALNNLNILENEKVNVWQAWQLMMNAYKEAIQNTEDAANRQMIANSAAAEIQAWWAIAWMAWLASNPAAASAARAQAQNQAAIQNAQIRSNADQNIANIYTNMAQVPSTLTSMSATNAQIDDNAIQTDANANLTNAQAEYYRRPQTSWGGSNSSTTTTTTTEEQTNPYESLLWTEIPVTNWLPYKVIKGANWNIMAVRIWDDWKFYKRTWFEEWANKKLSAS